MTLNEIHKSLCAAASGIPDYASLTKNQLANGYCDADEAGDKILMNSYWAAILLRYWHWTYRWKESCSSLRPSQEDLFLWLNEAITDAFNYRSWRKVRHDGYAEKDLVAKGDHTPVWIENPQFVHDENAADKSINFFLGAKRGKEYQEANKHRRKLNAVCYSVDELVGEDGDTVLDHIGQTDKNICNGAKELIERFLQEGNGIGALILDGIINHDSFKQTKSVKYKVEIDEETGEEHKEKGYDYKSTFDIRKLVKHLNSIDESFMRNYFCGMYEVSDIESNSILKMLAGMDNSKLYSYIKKTLYKIRLSDDLLGYLTAN